MMAEDGQGRQLRRQRPTLVAMHGALVATTPTVNGSPVVEVVVLGAGSGDWRVTHVLPQRSRVTAIAVFDGECLGSPRRLVCAATKGSSNQIFQSIQSVHSTRKEMAARTLEVTF